MPFRDVLGHRRVVALLARSVAHRSLPPSLIFAGPEGVGKRLVATATAQALNCTEIGAFSDTDQSDRSAPSAVPDACGVCAACRRIARGVHPDVLVVAPGESGTIKIDQVREVIDRAAYRPFEGRRRVVIIDEADALVVPAQSALLKTLEEPPPASVFLLITSRPDALLPTVRSRCPRLTFRPLAPDEIARALVAQGRSQADARAVAGTAEGSLGRALAMSGVDLVAAREVAQQVLARAAGHPDARRRIEGAKELLPATGKAGAADRDQLASRLRAMASILRDVAAIDAHADARVLANADLRPALERLVATYRGERGVRAFEAIDRALVALDRNAGAKVVADWLVLQL